MVDKNNKTLFDIDIDVFDKNKFKKMFEKNKLDKYLINRDDKNMVDKNFIV